MPDCTVRFAVRPGFVSTLRVAASYCPESEVMVFRAFNIDAHGVIWIITPGSSIRGRTVANLPVSYSHVVGFRSDWQCHTSQHTATERFESLLQGQHAEEENCRAGGNGHEIRTGPEAVARDREDRE